MEEMSIVLFAITVRHSACSMCTQTIQYTIRPELHTPYVMRLITD